MKRLMIAGTGSGCGKTTVVCAIVHALKKRGIDTAVFKCGPDYIDPMFHSYASGTKARNLDSWFCDENTVNYLLKKNAGEVSVIESAMGFYDGVNGSASAFDIALSTRTPVVIVVDCKGMSSSVGAVMKGFLTYRTPNNICGFIFDRLSESLVPEIRKLCCRLGTEYLGRMPYDRSCAFESRRLGLVAADEVTDIREKLNRLAEYAEKYIDMSRLITIAGNAVCLEITEPFISKTGIGVRIAVAHDDAFCFLYEDNLEILRDMGCKIVEFSPLIDKCLPNGVSGIILCGGYPELHLHELCENISMLEDIRKAVEARMPIIAECGGFMYLHKTIEYEGEEFRAVGAISAKAYKTDRLQRFGYTYLTAEKDNMLCRKGEVLKSHEFHYWDSTCCGNDFTAEKARTKAVYRAVHSDMRSYMGFPHLYFYSDIKIAENFVKACLEYGGEHGKDRENNSER